MSIISGFSRSLVGLVIAGTVTCFVIGCGGGENVSSAGKLHAVKGKVKLEGSGSLTGVKIKFLPSQSGSSARTATGEIKSDGSFELTTETAGDGIAEGEYRVKLEPASTAVDKTGKVAKSTIPTPYLDEENSGLTASIKADTTEVGPFVIDPKNKGLATGGRRGRDND